MDQAVGLRKKGDGQSLWNGSTLRQSKSIDQRPIRAMAIGSGKGGVGKSNVVVNLALALDTLGERVLIMDADLGLANIDILLGLTPKYNVSHILNGTRRLDEVLVKGPRNIRIMPASSGVQELTRLTHEQKLVFLEMLDEMETDIDILLIDTSAGISDMVLYFNMAAQERIIVVTPEPTSLTDAYALIKVLYTRHGRTLLQDTHQPGQGRKVRKGPVRQDQQSGGSFPRRAFAGLPREHSLRSLYSQGRDSAASATRAFSRSPCVCCLHEDRHGNPEDRTLHEPGHDTVFLETIIEHLIAPTDRENICNPGALQTGTPI